ncbi:cyanate lyase C-terminal domain-containing protein [Mucidula mucida]|nr:cyanate lyase C-terminal domain-containing protein [Mucidula mucida]
MSQASTIPSSIAPYANLPSANSKLFEAKAKKGITFDAIAKAIGKDEVWVAAAFYGQAKFTEEDSRKYHWWPNRGLGPMPPTDPVIYRLYDSVLVYGTAIKAIIHEKFGDGIMSMIDCKVTVERKPDPKGDRAVLTFGGKFLPYAKW